MAAAGIGTAPYQDPYGPSQWDLYYAAQKRRATEEGAASAAEKEAALTAAERADIAAKQRAQVTQQQAMDLALRQLQGLGGLGSSGGGISAQTAMPVPSGGVSGGISAGSYSSSSPATVVGGGGGATPNNDAVYAAAKDKIGNQMRASLMALRDSAAEGGQFAAGGQNPALQGATERLISRGQGQMGDVARQQAAQQAANAQKEEEMRLAAELGLNTDLTVAGVNQGYNLQNIQAEQNAAIQRSLISSLFGLFGSGGLY